MQDLSQPVYVHLVLSYSAHLHNIISMFSSSLLQLHYLAHASSSIELGLIRSTLVCMFSQLSLKINLYLNTQGFNVATPNSN